MSTSASSSAPAYQPALAWFTALAGAWVFVLVMLGAFTTSIGAGMVFPDWPLSHGSINPAGWLTDLAMFAEHSHRLSAGVMSLLTVAIAVVMHRRESRPWLRRLAVFAVGLVLAQALVGGLRVLLDHLHIETVNTSVGRMFAMAHACLAQIYICTLLALVLPVTRPWVERSASAASGEGVRWRGLSVGCVVLLLVQLAIAAVMRHSFAGLAIPTFPWSTPAGDLLPADWNFRVGIHFAHRAMAIVLSVAIVWLAVRIHRDPTAGRAARAVSLGLVLLLVVQIVLGAASVLTYRHAYVTTAHVLVGALMLASCFGLAWWAYRDAIDAPSTGSAAPASLRP
jgi:cytochrome c oxidase assembly protein subunit 15